MLILINIVTINLSLFILLLSAYENEEIRFGRILLISMEQRREKKLIGKLICIG
jgi:hypothetical protein